MNDLANPNHCLCENLRSTARLVTRAYDQALAPAQLTSTQFSTLYRLSRMGPVGVSDLASAMGTDRTGLTRNIALLEKAGLVDRQEGEDRRQRSLALTAEGRARLDRALPLWRSVQARLTNRTGGMLARELLQDLAALRMAAD